MHFLMLAKLGHRQPVTFYNFVKTNIKSGHHN